ncbi:MAG TPA: FAD-dependent oxidoreductase [Cytophaga sp.]|jgi:glycine/D-amino acid oxidase-like deaminating enzyme/nitrite reductase/ring-hydroxylating ferredoxin subunit|nr:FAD-dependent oxidoreductase [Cytophaga sp.]
MKRDGQCISLWQNMPEHISKHMPAEADVVIVGGGITGISTALRLQREGKKCVVLEAQNIGFGTTGGTTCHLNTLLDTPYYTIKNNFGEKNAQLVYALTDKALNLIEKNILGYDIDCGFARKDAYLFSQDEKQSKELDKIVEAANEVGLEMDFSKSIPVPLPFEKAAKISGQGQMHITKYLYGIAEAFERMGGRIIQNCRVTDCVEEQGETIVLTSKGKIKAAHVVYATHTPPGVNVLHFEIAPYRSYVLAVTLVDNTYPDALVYDLDEPYHYYRTQEADGKKYLIFGGEDHKTGHEEHTEFCFTKLESYLRKYYNIDQVVFKWSSQYFESVDGIPYIGHLPGNPENVWVATGFGGNGIIYGTATACILTDLICKGSSPYEKLFSPSRFKPAAGFANAVKEGTDVIKQFAGKKLAIEKINGASELAHNEAKLVKYEGRSVGLYKDEQGKLFAVNPACPHINCSVSWNGAEKSWDCPCHGSRFSFTGELMTAPARKDLEMIELFDPYVLPQSEKLINNIQDVSFE